MGYISPEKLKEIKKIDLLSYLQQCEPEELVKDSRNTYMTKTHDSLKISNGMWYWFSKGIGGNSALEYLIQVKGFSLTEAASYLMDNNIQKIDNNIPKKKEPKKLKLPIKAKNNDIIFNYLRGRGISKDIILECINKGLMYQDKYDNVVFLGYNEKNIPKYAGVRSTDFTRFMYECSGSDKNYSFRLNSIKENNTVHIFESAIDLLSYATLKELKNEQWDEENLLSLAGVYKIPKNIEDSKVPSVVEHYLENNPKIDTLVLHFDNDEAGRDTTKSMIFHLSASYKIIDEPPKGSKDVNDFLKKVLKFKNNFVR